MGWREKKKKGKEKVRNQKENKKSCKEMTFNNLDET